MHNRPFVGTLWGIGIGVLALAIWMLTFSPHGGVELSWYLFPLTRLILDRIYPTQSVPALLWFGGALLQWIVAGVLVDLLRWKRWRFSLRTLLIATTLVAVVLGLAFYATRH